MTNWTGAACDEFFLASCWEMHLYIKFNRWWKWLYSLDFRADHFRLIYRLLNFLLIDIWFLYKKINKLIVMFLIVIYDINYTIYKKKQS